jgi:hypothetical protein
VNHPTAAGGCGKAGTIKEGMRIGEILIDRGLVTRQQLSEALRAQVIYGGRVGTNLVELGYVDLDSLAQALGFQHDLAYAVAHHFEVGAADLRERLPPRLAAEYLAVPVLQREPAVAVVAFADPPSPEAMRIISGALRSEIVPAVVPELRLRYQLEVTYGLPRPNRYLRASSGDRSATGKVRSEETRRYVQPLSADPTAVPEASTLGRVTITQRRVIRRARDLQTSTSESPSTLQEALVAIRRASDRDRVVEFLVEGLKVGCGQPLGAGILLLVRNGVAIGWNGYCDSAADDVVQSIAVPLSEPSMLRQAWSTGALASGAPANGGQAIDRRFWAMLGSGTPGECGVAPIRVRDDVVCLIYVHAADLGALYDSTINAITALANVTGSTFMKLIYAADR